MREIILTVTFLWAGSAAWLLWLLFRSQPDPGLESARVVHLRAMLDRVLVARAQYHSGIGGEWAMRRMTVFSDITGQWIDLHDTYGIQIDKEQLLEIAIDGDAVRWERIIDPIV